MSHARLLAHTLLCGGLLVGCLPQSSADFPLGQGAARVPVVSPTPSLRPSGRPTAQNASGGVTAPVTTATTVPLAQPAGSGLRGFVDLHAHPMTNLAFGGKLIHGGVDVGSLLPTDEHCQNQVRATSMAHALSVDSSSHGGWGVDNRCGDTIRKQIIHTLQAEKHAAVTPDGAGGGTEFRDWPRWDDITHQKMWVDWIRRARDGGLRVMVALATNNRSLSEAVSGPGDGPSDNKASADLQIAEMKAFVLRHDDFMEVAYTPADLQRIVSANKLAIVLGVEIDDIGNFNSVASLTEERVEAELDRLVTDGVRYIFPIHVIDNPFGGTAVYEGTFNLSNYRESGHFWDIECTDPADGIDYRFTPSGFDIAVALVKVAKLGMDPFRHPGTPPECQVPGTGHQNVRGLTPLGEFAIKAMMRRGMLLDIDHMSQKSANRAIAIAESVPGGGYPVNSGHNGLRGAGSSENTRTVEQLRRIATLQGIVGMGTEAADAHTWIRDYATVLKAMGKPGAGMGTDLNGLVQAPKPRPGSHVVYDETFPISRSGSKTWDYNVDGVAHYGLLADWVRDMKTAPGGAALVDESLMHSADYFWRTWQRAEAQKTAVR